jgi:hypothetical protein
MSIIYQILNALLCGGMAAIDADRIESGKKINHWVNGLVHIAVSTGAFFVFDWKIALAILFQSRVVFDVALNLFRGLPIDYISAKPASLIDRMEKKVFGSNGILPKIIYLTISIILNFI